MALLILMLKTGLFVNKIVNNIGGIRTSDRENTSNNNGNNSNKRIRKKLTKLKNRNLVKFKKIAKNSAIKTKTRFLVSIAKETFNQSTNFLLFWSKISYLD